MSAERWGGSIILRQGIEREIHYLTQDLRHTLEQIPAVQQSPSPAELTALAQILVPLALNWAMGWIQLQAQPDPALRQTRINDFKAQSLKQLELLFRGILSQA